MVVRILTVFFIFCMGGVAKENFYFSLEKKVTFTQNVSAVVDSTNYLYVAGGSVVKIIDKRSNEIIGELDLETVGTEMVEGTDTEEVGIPLQIDGTVNQLDGTVNQSYCITDMKLFPDQNLLIAAYGNNIYAIDVTNKLNPRLLFSPDNFFEFPPTSYVKFLGTLIDFEVLFPVVINIPTEDPSIRIDWIFFHFGSLVFMELKSAYFYPQSIVEENVDKNTLEKINFRWYLFGLRPQYDYHSPFSISLRALTKKSAELPPIKNVFYFIKTNFQGLANDETFAPNPNNIYYFPDGSEPISMVVDDENKKVFCMVKENDHDLSSDFIYILSVDPVRLENKIALDASKEKKTLFYINNALYVGYDSGVAIFDLTDVRKPKQVYYQNFDFTPEKILYSQNKLYLTSGNALYVYKQQQCVENNDITIENGGSCVLDFQKADMNQEDQSKIYVLMENGTKETIELLESPISFKLKVEEPGKAAVIKLTFPKIEGYVLESIVKYVDNQWKEFPRDLYSIENTKNSYIVTIIIEDGGAWDSDHLVNGIVIDPIAPYYRKVTNVSQVTVPLSPQAKLLMVLGILLLSGLFLKRRAV